MVGKIEWQMIKQQYGNKCALCKRTEKQVGILEKAHMKAKSKSGSQYFPMCLTCHTKFDKGLLNLTEMKKLGIPDKKTYERLKPKKRMSEDDYWFGL